jgi:adenosylcobinamide-GDP ribazoletransferase
MPARRTALAAYAQELAADLMTCLRFCTRLPIRVFAFETEPYRPLTQPAARLLPVAGALIGVCAALALGLAAKLGLPAPLPALVALTALLTLTGALHEDGLADCADGFGGGTTQETRLAVMKDPRLGTFGALALILALLLRAASLARIAEEGLWLASCVLVATAATSRGLALMPLWLLPPARQQGSGLAAANPSPNTLVFAAASAAILALLPLSAGASIARILLAALTSIAGAGAVILIARRAIGGQTGDVAGATQQTAEICAYLVFAAQLRVTG